MPRITTHTWDLGLRWGVGNRFRFSPFRSGSQDYAQRNSSGVGAASLIKGGNAPPRRAGGSQRAGPIHACVPAAGPPRALLAGLQRFSTRRHYIRYACRVFTVKKELLSPEIQVPILSRADDARNPPSVN